MRVFRRIRQCGPHRNVRIPNHVQNGTNACAKHGRWALGKQGAVSFSCLNSLFPVIGHRLSVDSEGHMVVLHFVCQRHTTLFLTTSFQYRNAIHCVTIHRLPLPSRAPATSGIAASHEVANFGRTDGHVIRKEGCQPPRWFLLESVLRVPHVPLTLREPRVFDSFFNKTA